MKNINPVFVLVGFMIAMIIFSTLFLFYEAIEIGMIKL